MKVKLTHVERSVVFYGRGDYIIDTNNFPELEGVTSEQEIADWVYNNQEELGVKFKKEGTDEIVPYKKKDKELGKLNECVSDSSVDWEKFGDEEHYFEPGYLNEDDTDDENDDEEAEESEEN